MTDIADKSMESIGKNIVSLFHTRCYPDYSEQINMYVYTSHVINIIQYN